MHDKRWLMVLAGMLLLGSLAGAAVWQLADSAPSGGAATPGDTAPASRAIFPKVLNH